MPGFDERSGNALKIYKSLEERDMRILTIGDVVGDSGTEAVCARLDEIKAHFTADFCIVNGENACSANGISRRKAEMLLSAGADVLTLGNHTFRQKDAAPLLMHNDRVIRPINYPPETAGRGVGVFEKNGVKIAVFNALGRIYLENVDCPFRALLGALEQTEADIKIVDFHAEATSEKRAMGYFLDGKASVVFGTHTHVQTADLQVLPKGTGYITDIGMSGPHHSCLGVDKNIVIDRFVTAMPHRFELADSPARIDGAVFAIDETNGKCTGGKNFSLLPGEAL